MNVSQLTKEATIKSLLKGEIDKNKAAEILTCSTRTIERYKFKYLEKGKEALKDKRSSNYFKLSDHDKQKIVQIKKKELWRSARNIRDLLNLDVSEHQVQRIILKAGIVKVNKERVKPIERFEAPYPNDLWQADIMGKINFKKLGARYLIGVIDDHSRFCLSARWFKTQNKMNVFQVWYEALSHYGIPNNMLHDRGSQYKAHTLLGQADYEKYAHRLGIGLIWANKAQTKGKIERFWKFVQDDYVRGVLLAKSDYQLNGEFKKWLSFYNYQFKSRYHHNQTKADKYHASERKLTRLELIRHLTIEERRKVSRESTISLYGKRYLVPRGYIGCRIWIKIIGNKIYLEANDKVFWKTNLQF